MNGVLDEAAADYKGYTALGGSQTSLITRLAGRTPVPAEQGIVRLSPTQGIVGRLPFSGYGRKSAAGIAAGI